MNIKTFLIFIFFFILTGCSLFISKFRGDALTTETITYKKEKNVKTYCKQKSNFSLISENKKNQKKFEGFINKLRSTHRLTFADEAVLWSLVQMNIRPDLSAPSAKMQFFIRYHNKQSFFHVFSKDQAYPYLHALNLLLQKYRGNYSLKQLGKIIDSSYSHQFYVTHDFETFLKNHKKKISSLAALKRFYIRGDETLKENETISKQQVSPLIARYLKGKKKAQYTVSNYLFTYKRNNLINAQCNYDMGLYNSSIYLIHKDVIQSNTFGLRKNNSVFLADSTQHYQQIKQIPHTLFFQGESQTRSPAMCQFSIPLKDKWDLWLVSTKSRDPGQHLFHLMEYGLQDMKNLKQIDNLLRFSRHLFLKNPIRLILESQRSNPAQLNELLKLNMPIYNAVKLARIWGYHHNEKEKSFILDERNSGSLTCQ